VALTMLVGPAHAGKVARLLDGFLASIDREPFLIVPTGSDVERAERDLLRRAGALLGGKVGTFDDIFAAIAAGGSTRPLVTDGQRALLLRRVVAGARLDELAGSARFAGFPVALGAQLAELEAGLLEPAASGGDLGRLHELYRGELDRLGLWDRGQRAAYAAERVASDLGAWDGRPVYAYGFEDLTAAQWRLLEALAGRTEVTVSLPYEPGRLAFASLRRTAEDLARLADGRIQELGPRYAESATPALAHLERRLFEEDAAAGPESEGSVRFLEGAGLRATLELVADEILALLRGGTPAAEIGVVCPSVERHRAALAGSFGALGVPYVVDGPVRLAQTSLGHALLSLLRFEWLAGGRRDLYSFLRSPYSGLSRAHADFLEGRLRGRAIERPERVEEETVKLRGAPLPFLERLRAAPTAIDAVRELAASMLRSAHGVDAPPAGEQARDDLRAYDAVRRVTDELTAWLGLGSTVSADELVAALRDAELRSGTAREGRVAVLSLHRARTRSFRVVFVLGLEEGVLPQRSRETPFLDDDRRRELDGRARLLHADPVARDRYLFYTACTRASHRLYLVREAATDDGAPRQPSPFWDDARALFAADDAARWTRRRSLSQLVWQVAEAPSERERLRAVAKLAATDEPQAAALARANGWERRLERAVRAFRRSTRLRHPAVLAELQSRQTFGVTELEAYGDCSSIWFVERLVDPRAIDGEVDARLRGQIAHQTLFRFFSGLPRRFGGERVPPDRTDEALELLRECLAEAMAGHVRLELTDLQRRELEQGLERDLEALVLEEAQGELPLVPRRFEVSFGTERSAQELQRGLELDGFALSGKIDRIDLDPFAARGIVWDYKSGARAHSAAQIEKELRLQIPLYMLVLRDLVGVEPLGGLYRPLAGDRKPRGLLRKDAKDDGVPGFSRFDYKDEEQFWGQVGTATAAAQGLVERIRGGEVGHDPRGGSCPAWCELGPMCRVRRA
jgi:ATP-dependent helicase/DNAse subunit B